MSFRDFWKYLTPFAFAAVATCGQAIKTAAQSGDFPSEPNWRQVCDKALAQPQTPPSFARAIPESQLKNCDSEALYYGYDRPADPSAALQCAYYERAHQDPSVVAAFAGPGVLTMLYANGKGVRRNYDLAIRFACEIPLAA